nr:MAG TPA: hypothetical protein [Caudoviricetes sp.]
MSVLLCCFNRITSAKVQQMSDIRKFKRKKCRTLCSI